MARSASGSKAGVGGTVAGVVVLGAAMMLAVAPPAHAQQVFPTIPQNNGGSSARIEFDVPQRIDPGKPFKMMVWVRGGTDRTTVHMEQDTDVSYAPSSFAVIPGKRSEVVCTLSNQKPRSGLVRVAASSDCCETTSVTLDAGFRLNAHPSGTDDGLLAGEQKMMAFDLVDGNQAVPLDGPLQMFVLASHAYLQDGTYSPHRTSLQKVVDRSGAKTPYFTITAPARWYGVPSDSMADVAVELRNEFGNVLLRQNFQIPVHPRWWAQFFAAIIGSLLWFALSTATAGASAAGRSTVRTFVFGLVSTIASGAAAYFVIASKLIGISVDTNGVLGYVVMGLLIQGSGAEAVLRAVASKAGVSAAPAPRTSPAIST